MTKNKNIFLFGVNFFKNPLRNASIIPSSNIAAKAMFDHIDFQSIRVIVELGPGTGVFTEEILKRCKPNTKVILIEIEESYIRLLRGKFGNKVIIEKASAHLLDSILVKHGINKVDLIISGLPFLLGGVEGELFETVKKHTKNGAIYRFFTYNPPAMKQMYKNLPIRKMSFVLRNFPPLWIYGIN